MRITNMLLTLCLTSLAAGAQTQWYNPLEAGFPVIQNQGWIHEIGQTYTRLPDRSKAEIRPQVWDLSRNSAGLAIHFYSNAPKFQVRYTVSGSHSMAHMPATGVSGIDLYATDSDGARHFCFGGFAFGDTICYTFDHIGKDRYHAKGYEYQLYLPLYNSVNWMEIGVSEGAELQFIPSAVEKPIMLYGTSIAQGACASRPGMAWGNILRRALDYPVVNLGFSGNGKLEKEVINYVAEVDARIYLLDCLPNVFVSSEAEIYQLVTEAVRQIRQTRTAPILLIEHIGYSNAGSDTLRYEMYAHANRASRKAYEVLLSEGVKELHYLSHEELNFPADAWVDYIHPSDLGMQQQATVVEKKVREILHLPQGTLPTTRPVTQRREPNNYEWQARHREVLALNKSNPPKTVILGNSITHFWGGEPVGPHQTGPDSWDKVMRPAGFRNMGYGWDRIENVLWRVYHDELDGYKAEKVVLMIGTNNQGISSDEEIVEGLRHLLSAIRQKQPQADIKVIGILPRRNLEAWVAAINQRIRQLTEKEGYRFKDAGTSLLQKDGKINETLFTDGLHPNAKGYRSIASGIAE